MGARNVPPRNSAIHAISCNKSYTEEWHSCNMADMILHLKEQIATLWQFKKK